MKRITVLMADDNGPVRREFRRILEREADLEVVGEARNGRQAVVMAEKLHPALVLMDAVMPLLNGFRAMRQILLESPGTKVIMLSVHGEEAYIQEAISSGASGYLIKHTSAGCVCAAIRRVQNGGTFFSPPIPSRPHQQKLKKPKPANQW